MLAITVTGCAVPEPVRSPVTSPDNVGAVTYERVPLSFDDPEAIFTPVFKQTYRAFAKQKLETEPEYRERLEAIGISGREVTFLIPPNLCDVFAQPDEGIYNIVTKDWWSSFPKPANENAYAVTVFETTEDRGSVTMSNAFGAKTDVLVFKGKRLKVRPDAFDIYPAFLKWPDPVLRYGVHFGLQVRTTDPSFRMLLKDKKIALAIRGKIGDLSRCDQGIDGVAPTLNQPVSIHHVVSTIPFTLDTVYVVDVTSRTTFAKWSK